MNYVSTVSAEQHDREVLGVPWLTVAVFLLAFKSHLGNAPSSDRDRVVPFFERPKGRLGLSDRENYETANTLGFRIGQGTGAIRRLVRRRRDDATAPSRFGKRPRPGCPHRRGSRARILLVASHDELAPSRSSVYASYSIQHENE